MFILVIKLNPIYSYHSYEIKDNMNKTYLRSKNNLTELLL